MPRSRPCSQGARGRRRGREKRARTGYPHGDRATPRPLDPIAAARTRLEQRQSEADLERGRSDDDGQKPRGRQTKGWRDSRAFGAPKSGNRIASPILTAAPCRAPATASIRADAGRCGLPQRGGVRGACGLHGPDRSHRARRQAASGNRRGIAAAHRNDDVEDEDARGTRRLPPTQVAGRTTERLDQERSGLPPAQHAGPEPGARCVETRAHGAESATNGDDAGGFMALQPHNLGPRKAPITAALPETPPRPQAAPKPLMAKQGSHIEPSAARGKQPTLYGLQAPRVPDEGVDVRPTGGPATAAGNGNRARRGLADG